MHIDLQQLTLFASMALVAPCTEPEEQVPTLGAEQLALSSVDSRAPRQRASTDKGHSAEATEMRRVAVASDLEALQREAARIAADSWSARLPPDLRQRLGPARAAARAMLAAPSMGEAALALGQLGSACASCHRQMGAPAAAAATETTAGAASEMAAHGRAEEALWVGLAYPSDESWLRAARSLSSGPSLDSDVAEVSALARRTSTLAQSALTTDTPRAALYGMIVATCAECHELLGVTP